MKMKIIENRSFSHIKRDFNSYNLQICSISIHKIRDFQ